LKRTGQRGRAVPGGARVFQRIYTRLSCAGRPPQFVVEYHPYADLTHTIRLREDTAYVRLSDALRLASREVLEATAAILLARLYRRRAPKELIEIYRQFSYARSTRRRLLALRQRRARRVENRPRGVYYDLAPMFVRLNRRYFRERLKQPRLGWSRRAWRTQLGCFDPALNQIVINRILDRQNVPEYAVAYVLYHEMLHLKHPMKFAQCRRESHSPQFRKEEKKFADFARAMRFLQRLAMP
jgi:hypothetical protein